MGNPESGAAPAGFVSVIVLVRCLDAWFEGNRDTGIATSVSSGIPWL